MNEQLKTPNPNRQPKQTKLKPIIKDKKIIGYAIDKPNIDYASTQEVSKFWTIVNFIINRLTKN